MKELPLKKITGRLTHVFDHDKAKLEPNPYKDWMAIFLLGCFSSLIVLLLNIASFILVQKNEIYLLDVEYAIKNLSTPDEIQDLNRRGLENVISLFSKKREVHDRLLREAQSNVVHITHHDEDQVATTSPEILEMEERELPLDENI